MRCIFARLVPKLLRRDSKTSKIEPEDSGACSKSMKIQRKQTNPFFKLPEKAKLIQYCYPIN